jgi:hypothetical protein
MVASDRQLVPEPRSTGAASRGQTRYARACGPRVLTCAQASRTPRRALRRSEQPVDRPELRWPCWALGDGESWCDQRNRGQQREQRSPRGGRSPPPTSLVIDTAGWLAIPPAQPGWRSLRGRAPRPPRGPPTRRRCSSRPRALRRWRRTAKAARQPRSPARRATFTSPAIGDVVLWALRRVQGWVLILESFPIDWWGLLALSCCRSAHWFPPPRVAPPG